MSLLLWFTGAALLIAGLIPTIHVAAGRLTIGRERSGQRITFPAADGLPAPLVRHAGHPVRTGEQARVFANLIDANVARATPGRTYAEIADEWQAEGRAGGRLCRPRETASAGQAPRGPLRGACRTSQVTLLVIGLGALFVPVGPVLMAMGGAWRGA